MNNFKVTVDGTYAVNFMDQVLTVKVKDGVAISRESELEAKLEIAVGALRLIRDGRPGWHNEVLAETTLEKLRGEA